MRVHVCERFCRAWSAMGARPITTASRYWLVALQDRLASMPTHDLVRLAGDFMRKSGRYEYKLSGGLLAYWHTINVNICGEVQPKSLG